MGNALRHVRGESQKNIVRFIEGLSGKYSRWDIWQDFIIMSAIAIANTMGGPQAKAREEVYRSRAEKYSATAAAAWLTAATGVGEAIIIAGANGYLSLAKSDHKRGGITFEAAKANNFRTDTDNDGSIDSPAI